MQHFNANSDEQDFLEDHPVTQQRCFDFLLEPQNYTNQNQIVDFDQFNLHKPDQDIIQNSKYLFEDCLPTRFSSFPTEADYTLNIHELKEDFDTISQNQQSSCLLSLKRQDSLSLLDNNEIIGKQQLLQCTRTDSYAVTRSDSYEDSAIHGEVDADMYLRNSVCSSDIVSQKSSKESPRYEINESTLTADIQQLQIPKIKINSKVIKRQIKQQIKHDEKVFCKSTGRKDKKTQEVLTRAFEQYQGKWDEQQFRELTYITGFNKRQLNKWFWDRKKKVRDSLKAKTLSYPGLLFQVTNTKTGSDLTPSFKTIICNKPIFLIEKASTVTE